MSEITLHAGDNRETLRRLIDQGVRVHSIVTDPPYGLVSVQKRFGKEGSAPARRDKNDGSFARLSGGFMGARWDGTGIERDPEFWRLLWEILLPGGYVFAFSGSRTGHWQACAMETAGFIMHPMHAWTFFSGFPKAHNASKAIDKHFGVEREVVGFDAKKAAQQTFAERTNAYGDYAGNSGHITAPATVEAAEWQGWAYGTQAQKPAIEPIYLGQKPFSEKTGAANILKHGVGAINIDGCRVPTNENLNGGAYAKTSKKDSDDATSFAMGVTGKDYVQPEGRHPSNLILDGSPEVLAMFPNSKSGKPGVRRKEHQTTSMSGTLAMTGEVEVGYAGEGSAARFFHQFTPDTDPLFCHPKAGKLDRAGSRHPTVKPIALMQYLIRHITPPGGVVLDPFAGSGTTGEAALREGFDCILMEAEKEYVEFLESRFSLNGSQATETSGEKYLRLLGL